jgi:hypothetical protein
MGTMGNCYHMKPSTYEVKEISQSYYNELLECPRGHIYGNYRTLKEATKYMREVERLDKTYAMKKHNYRILKIVKDSPKEPVH